MTSPLLMTEQTSKEQRAAGRSYGAMSFREYVAVEAMAALLASRPRLSPDEVSDAAVCHADALVVKLSQRPFE